MSYAFLRPREVFARRGRCSAAVYADVESGLFPRPVKLGPRASGWPEYEVEALQRANLAGLPPDAIRAIVTELHALRDEGRVLDEAGVVAMIQRQKGRAAA